MSKIVPFLIASLLPLVSLSADDEQLVTESQETPASFDSFTGRVVGHRVRMRTQPDLEGHVVRETNSGEMFAITGEQNDFFAVQPPKGTKGYVFRTYILEDVVEADRVNVRLYPDLDAPIVGRLNCGDTVHGTISDINSKWLEIDLLENSHFYIAHEYIEKVGPIQMLAKIEARHHEASHKLSAASLYARSEVQKAYQEIDFESAQRKFEAVLKEYADLPDIVSEAQESLEALNDAYVQKKLAFLEGEPTASHSDHQVMDAAKLASTVTGLASPKSDTHLTDQMLVWQPLEEAIYHLWAAEHGDATIEAFYAHEEESAQALSGIVEPYNRPVKNRPGDFILKEGNLPVAFLYSTKVDLHDMVGKKVTVIAAPRPNNSFAFPAYHVLSVE